MAPAQEGLGRSPRPGRPLRRKAQGAGRFGCIRDGIYEKRCSSSFLIVIIGHFKRQGKRFAPLAHGFTNLTRGAIFF
jgi:hypothetical protein